MYETGLLTSFRNFTGRLSLRALYQNGKAITCSLCHGLQDDILGFSKFELVFDPEVFEHVKKQGLFCTRFARLRCLAALNEICHLVDVSFLNAVARFGTYNLNAVRVISVKAVACAP